MMNWFDAAVPNQVNSLNYFLEAARGRITGHEVVTVKGWNSSIGSSYETIGVHSTGVRNYQSSATTVQVSSSDANDTSAGTGARTVTIAGLNGSLAPLTETVTMNGQTVVNTSGTFLYINSATVATVGSGGVPAGTIYISKNGATVVAGVPSTSTDILEVVLAGYNRSLALVYTVKANYTGFLMAANIFGGIGTASSAFAINRRVNSTGLLIPELVATTGSSPMMQLAIGGVPLIILNAGDTIDVRAFNSAGTGMGGILSLVLIQTT